MDCDVLVIGGGVIGCAVLRELSKYKVDVVLVEREPDVGWGSTKANYGLVCQGGDVLEFRRGYQKTELALRSIPVMEELCRKLDVPFKKIGKLSLIRNTTELERFKKLKARAEKAGPPIESPRILSRDELLEIEPNVNGKVIGALYDPMMAAVDPVRFTIALYENARENGAEVLLETEVLSIEEKDLGFSVETSSGKIKAGFIVNAAGINADSVARMINADDFVLYPVKGVVGILDKKVGDLVRHEIHGIPRKMGAGHIVTPTVHGNVLFGMSMRLSRKGDTSVPRDMIKDALENARELVPDISQKDVITFFAGFLIFRNFEVGWHESVVRASRRNPRFVHAVMGFPGVSAAPGVADEVVKILRLSGLVTEKKENFKEERKDIPHFSEMSDDERAKVIRENPAYGHVVCRCEHVTEGEIVEAIRRGARTLDGVKFRTRAGMGRCQGGFCTPRVVKILARELGIPETEVTKKGKGSELLPYRAKELLWKRMS